MPTSSRASFTCHTHGEADTAHEPRYVVVAARLAPESILPHLCCQCRRDIFEYVCQLHSQDRSMPLRLSFSSTANHLTPQAERARAEKDLQALQSWKRVCQGLRASGTTRCSSLVAWLFASYGA
jgi:hypothetical protein